jgi:L-iditol 2-dehydrogenase
VPNTVRAATLVAPRTYRLSEFPWPRLEPGGVLVKNLLSGICGTDKHTFEGYTTQYSGTDNPSCTPFPIIQGHENVGEVVEINGDVADFDGAPIRVGDRVVVGPNVTCRRCYSCTHGLPYTLCSGIRDYGNTISAADPPHLFGGWAEYLYALPGSHIFRVPDDLPTHVAVLTEVFAVTAGLDRAQSVGAFPAGGYRFGSTVVVYGTGPLGLCHVAKAHLTGAAQVVAIDLSPTRLSFAGRLGATTVLDARDLGPIELIRAVKDLTGGLGADVVVECVGLPQAVPTAIDMLRVGGTLVEAGNFSDLGTVAIHPNRHLCSKGITVIGVPGQEAAAYGPSMRMMAAARGRLPFDEMVSNRFPLTAVERAVQTSIDPDSLKVVIDPWSTDDRQAA